ncbi:VWA domain-containing protein [soil metagenome]
MRFAEPAFLLLLLLLPILALLRGGRGSGPAVVFSSLHLVGRLGKRVRTRAGRLLVSIWLLTLALLSVALARPQLQRTLETVNASGVEIILALDVSLSMNIEDFLIGGRQVNRLTAAKKVMREFIQGRASDRIGIVAFSGRPYTPSPLTMDQDWLLDSIDRLELGVVKESGTAIGSGIAAAAKRLDQRESKSKIVVLLTDGANNSGNLTPRTAAELARTLGIKIYTIAVGTPGMHRIPDPSRPGAIIKVSQEFDVETLQAIADISGGAFYMAENTESLERIFDTINQMEKTEISRTTVVEADELFPIPAGAGLVTACVAFVLAQTFWRRVP